jgi:hypothetical protein
MTDQETPGKPAAAPVDLMPRQLHVSIVVDKASCGSGVMLRDLADGKMAGVFGHYMEPSEARKIARWLRHAADVAEGNNALAERLTGEGYAPAVVQRAVTQRTAALLGQGHEETEP